MSLCHNDNDLAAATGHDCTTDSPWRFTGTNIKYNLDLIETIDLVETIQYDIQHHFKRSEGNEAIIFVGSIYLVILKKDQSSSLQIVYIP